MTAIRAPIVIASILAAGEQTPRSDPPLQVGDLAGDRARSFASRFQSGSSIRKTAGHEADRHHHCRQDADLQWHMVHVLKHTVGFGERQ